MERRGSDGGERVTEGEGGRGRMDGGGRERDVWKGRGRD